MVFDISMKKRTARQSVLAVFLIILIISNLTFIWINSSKVSTESDKTSSKVAKIVVKNTVKNFDALPKTIQQKHIKKVNSTIRTSAHFVEFIPLGLLLFLLGMCFLKSSDRRVCVAIVAVCSLVLCIICATSDEVHQIFVKGRTFELKDIITDSLGSLVGIAIGSLAVLGIRKPKSE